MNRGNFCYVLNECADKENILVLWEIGDHGGGPSRVDLNEITEFMKEHTELNIKHSTPDEYFKTVNKDKLKVIEKSAWHVYDGCYNVYQMKCMSIIVGNGVLDVP